MSKKNAKVFSIVVLLTLVLSLIGTGISVFASTEDSNTNKVDDYFTHIDSLFLENGISVEYSQLTNDEVNADFSMLERTSKGRTLLKDLTSQGYVENQIDNPYNIRLVSKEDSSLITDSIYKFYENVNGDRIMIQLIIDQTNSQINHVVAQKVVNGSNKSVTIFEESSKTLYTRVKRASFSFNGKSFACSMTGLLTCSSYCVIWGVINTIAGIACEAACGTAMAAVCATV